jgi:feruloyl-CoA synthase
MGEHLWSEIDRQAEAATGTRILQTTGLGSTETAPFALFCTDPQDRPGNVGIPAKGITLKLVPQEGQWEARLKGPNVTPGYWRDPAQTASAFDEEGFYKLGDALRFADAADPAKGFFFDGRTAENFKMSTGTWVGVGNLRKRIVDALDGMVSDAVIAGEGREALGVLLVPFRPAIERVVPNGAALADAEIFAHPAARAAVAKALAAYNAKAGGASERIARARFFATPPDRAKGELTEKGSVNQRVALRLRDAEVAAMFADDGATIVIGK